MMSFWRICFPTCFWLVSGEVFTSMKDVESLMMTEKALLKVLDRYIHSRENEINQLEMMAEGFRRERATESDAPHLMSNPVNNFKIVRRHVRDWEIARLLIIDTGIQDEARRKWRDIERTMSYPREEDLGRAASRLFRVKDVEKCGAEYKCKLLNTTLTAKGKLAEVNNSSELTAADYFELGVYSYNELEYQLSGKFMYEALARYKEERNGKSIGQTDLSSLKNTLKWKIYDYLPCAIFTEGNKGSAFNLTKEIIDNFSRQHDGVWECQELIINTIKIITAGEKILTGSSLRFENKEQGREMQTFSPHLMESYKLLCQGAISTPTSVISKLRCRYVSTNPFTKLARLKEEEANLNPRIVVFRNVIHDSEIEDMKAIVIPNMRRGIVADAYTGEFRTTEHRIVKQFQLLRNETEVVEKVFRRAEDMSRMSAESAEDVLLINYGVGGHYVLHYDHATPYIPGVIRDWDGNRIASLLFYLSDVGDGGHTVFPALNITVRPEKGSVVMWRDLLYNGEGDDRVLHAACPVTIGSKWVTTVFLHTTGNELLQPCKLNRFE